MATRAGGGLFVEVDSAAATRYLSSLADATAALGRMRLVAGSPVPYAYGIETGRTRSGRVARARGGARMVEHGMAETRRQIPRIVAQLLQRPTGGVAKDVEDAFRRTALGAIQSRTPVVFGRLRNSFVVRRLH